MPIIALAVGLATAMAGAIAAAEEPAPRPNILVVVTDDLGWGQPGFNGGTEVGTPNLDRIANEGVKLTQFYVSPGCSPTRSALLTGRHYWKTGGVEESATRHLDVGVLLDERLMSEALRDAGYETWAIGKWHLGLWHLGHLPLQRGFDHHYGMYSGFITYGSHRHLGGLDWHRNGRPVVERGYSTFLKAEEAVQLIGRHDGRDPFFLYLAFNAAHGPDGAPEEYVERYADAAEPVQRAQVKALDDALGWVLGALEDKGVLDDTLVVYLNDNGGTARAGGNAPYRGLKGAFHEGGIRVPAAMRWPGGIPEGSESDALLHVVDVFPTLAGLAGASTTDGLPLDGLDAWQAIAAGAESPRQELAHSRKVMRVGDWKLLDTNGVSYGRRWSSRRELYNIAEDPYEETNLAGSEPAKVAELRARLTHHREAARGPAPAAQMPEVRVTYGFDENAAYGTAVERAYTELQAGNPGPTLVGLEVLGDVAALRYDEELDAASVPDADRFRAVAVPAYAAVDVNEVEVVGTEVRLKMARTFATGETLGLTYEVPDDGAIRNLDRLDAVGVTWVTAEAQDQPLQAGPVIGRDHMVDIDGDPKSLQPRGLWGDRDTVWVADYFDSKLYAYRQADGGPASSRDIDTHVGARRGAKLPTGVWGNGETIWVADSDADRVYAYRLRDGARHAGRDIALVTDGVRASGLWSDGETLWVLDKAGRAVHAYALHDGARDQAKDFELSAGRFNWGLWSDGDVFWTVDFADKTAYAYRDGSRLASADIALDRNRAPSGLWSDGVTVWVSEYLTGGLRAYALPWASTNASLVLLGVSGTDLGPFSPSTTAYSAAVANGTATVMLTATPAAGARLVFDPPDADAAAEGHQVALAEGSNMISVTVTAADGTTTETYTVTLERLSAGGEASADAALSALALSGIDIGTFAAGTTSYTATVANDVASTQVTATPNDAGASVTITDANGSTAGTSRTVALTTGSNAIMVTVTAEDSTTASYTVTVTREAAETALTALFASVPGGHDGLSPFELRIRFSEELANGSGRKVARALSVSEGTRGLVLRVGAARDLFKFQLTPSGDGDVTVSLNAPSGCGDSDSVCTADGRALSNAPSVTVEGPDAASTDATLSSLTLTGVDIGTFAAGTTAYTASVGNAVASTQVTAAANHSGADVAIADGNGSTDGASRNVSLDEGSNTITVTVTAEDGTTTQTYTVTVTREAASTDATLSSLALSAVDIGTFAAGTTAYTAGVGNAVASTQVTATPNHSAAGVTIADGAGSTDGTSRTVALAEGANTVTVMVTAEDGVTTQTYTVTVTRTAASADATLSSLSLSGIDIGTFAAGTGAYSASVGNAVASTEVTATANNASASVTIADGAGSTDGTSRTVALAEGANTITVTVTAGDGLTTAAYTVTVTRDEPALTARFENVPDGHDGSSPFDLSVRFSEELAKGSRSKVSSAIPVSGATRGRVRRVGDTRVLFTFALTPFGNGDVTVRLRASSDCSRLDSVCTADGRALSNTLSVTVNGPAAVGASANGPVVTLMWDTPRDDFGSPSGSDYGVRVNGKPRGVASAALSGATVWLTLESPVAAGDAVTVAYLGSSMHPLAEATGQVRSAPWEGLAAANLTGIEPPEAPAVIVDWRPADPLTVAADDALRLDASGLGLSEVWGVERLTVLERLDLSDNAVSDLSPLAGLANLRDLDLSGNRVADLWPLGALHNLARLNLSANRITDVQALAGLPNLKVLLLDGNAVADAWPLAALEKLENLGLAGNRIGDVTALQDLARLRRLDLTGNPAADLSPLGDVGSLVWLALPGDRLRASAETLGRLTRLHWVWSGRVETERNDVSTLR